MALLSRCFPRHFEKSVRAAEFQNHPVVGKVLVNLEGWGKRNSATGAFQRISSNFPGELFYTAAADMACKDVIK